jgi:hypothetical protein
MNHLQIDCTDGIVGRVLCDRGLDKSINSVYESVYNSTGTSASVYETPSDDIIAPNCPEFLANNPSITLSLPFSAINMW